MDPDRGLVEAAAGGSREAFDGLVRRYQAQIVNLARAMTSSDADVDDLAQETFVRAWRAIATFRSQSSFKTWLYGIAINVIRTHRGRRARLRLMFWTAPKGADPAVDPLERASADDGSSRRWRCGTRSIGRSRRCRRTCAGGRAEGRARSRLP